MGRRDTYEPGGDGPAGPGGAFNLMRLVGHSRHISSGFVGFAIKAVSVSAGASIVFGLTSYCLLGKHLGPVVPFLGGSAFGFVGGLVHRYWVDGDEARLMLSKYPKVIEHHVTQVEPMELRDTTFPQWLATLNLRKKGVLVAALYSASESLAKLQEQEEERILEEHYSGGGASAK